MKDNLTMFTFSNNKTDNTPAMQQFNSSLMANRSTHLSDKNIRLNEDQ